MITQETISDAVSRLVAAAQPTKIILFGSHSRGTAHDHSDLDFLVIEDYVSARRAETVRLQDALRPLRIPVDIVVTSDNTYKAWQDTPNTVYYDATRDGIVCFEKATDKKMHDCLHSCR
jgi:predicted nucleotidyltransferase